GSFGSRFGTLQTMPSDPAPAMTAAQIAFQYVETFIVQPLLLGEPVGQLGGEQRGDARGERVQVDTADAETGHGLLDLSDVRFDRPGAGTRFTGCRHGRVQR